MDITLLNPTDYFLCGTGELGYDRPVLAVGSVNKLLPRDDGRRRRAHRPLHLRGGRRGQAVQLGLVRASAIPLDTASPELPRRP